MPSYIATPSLWRTGWRGDKTSGRRPEPRLGGFFRRSPLRTPRTSPHRATGLAARKKFLRPAIRLPCAVKFRALRARSEGGSTQKFGQPLEVPAFASLGGRAAFRLGRCNLSVL